MSLESATIQAHTAQSELRFFNKFFWPVTTTRVVQKVFGATLMAGSMTYLSAAQDRLLLVGDC